MNLDNFIIILLVISRYAYASNLSEEKLDEILKPLINERRVMLEEINKMGNKIPKIIIKNFINEKLGEYSEIDFQLYPDFTFDLEYFNDILKNDDLCIKIYLNFEIRKLIRDYAVNSSEYVNKFLKHLEHKENITVLQLSCLYLTEIPEEIQNFKNLKILNLRFNNLRNLKFDWSCLENLEELHIKGNKEITVFDDSFFDLLSLKEFDAEECSITEIPESINKLENLTELHLISNPIVIFPKNISNIKKLHEFNISKCAFKELVINLFEQPELHYIDLSSNSSLEHLKLLIPEVPQDLKYLNIGNCPLVNAEVCIVLKNTRLNAFICDKQSAQDADYVIKLNPNELISYHALLKMSEFKLFRYDIESRSGSSKTITIREFNFAAEQNVIKQNKLIGKWFEILKKSRLLHENSLHDERDRSIEFLKNLYKLQISEYKSNLFDFLPFEYKKKMISILNILFDNMREKCSEYQVRSMLQIFKRPTSEQLVYLNFLLNYKSLNPYEKIYFIDFIKQVIEVLKDYLFTACLNFEEYKNSNYFKNLFRTNLDKKKGHDKERRRNLLFNELVRVITNAKQSFDSKFTVDYLSRVIYNIMDTFEVPEFFDNDMIYFLIDNFELGPGCFDYVTQANVEVIKKVNFKGIKAIVNTIIN